MVMTIVKNIRNLKLFILIWYNITVLTILSTPVLSNEGTSDEATACISNAECSLICKKYGNILLQFKEKCNHYFINLDFEMKTSIINLTMYRQRLTDNTSLTKSDNNPERTFTIKVNISEPTVYDNGIEEDILQEEWVESQSDAPIPRHYLSRTSNVSICVSSIGNWSYYNITFSFDEIIYSLNSKTMSTSNGSGVIEDLYRPNSVSLYRLIEEGNNKWKGITFTVGDLNINKEMGEYLLIGSGSDIFESEDYLPLYVTEVMQNASFYVDNSNVYVAFVSGPIQKDEMFQLLWNCEGKKTAPNVNEDHLGVLNSSLICFYNYTEAMKEFQRSDDEKFKSFRQNFAEAVIIFLVQFNLTGAFKNIDSLDKITVELFGQPTAYGNALSILIKVMNRGKSIFTWRQLQIIIEIFEQRDNSLSLGYSVGKCPGNENELPYKEKWSFIIYALVPVFGLFALLMWAWKQRIFTQKYTPEKEETLCPAPLIPQEPNQYETTPKVCPDNSLSRRQTLFEGSSQPETERRDEEITVEMNVIPSTSRSSSTRTQFLTSKKSKHRPSIQSLIDKKEETRPEVGKTMCERNESEPLYDSVSNNIEMDETNL